MCHARNPTNQEVCRAISVLTRLWTQSEAREVWFIVGAGPAGLAAALFMVRLKASMSCCWKRTRREVRSWLQFSRIENYLGFPLQVISGNSLASRAYAQAQKLPGAQMLLSRKGRGSSATISLLCRRS